MSRQGAQEHSTDTSIENHLVRIAPLASATGRYGGPFDTAVGQASLASQLPNIKVTLLAPHFRDDGITSPLDSGAAFVSPVVRRLWPNTGFTLTHSVRGFRATWSAIRSAQLVHVSFSRELYPLISAVTTLALRRKLIIQPHGMLTARTSRVHSLIDLIVKPVVRRANTVIALTDVEGEALRRWMGTTPRFSLHVIGNPVRVDADLTELSKAQRRREALFIARLHPRKRVADFADAAQVAHEKGWIRDEYVVVGPDQGDLSVVANMVGAIPGLTYEGAIPGSRVLERLSESRVFVLPSRDEPWGNVLVAAVSIGLPVVVTKSAALAEPLGDAGVAIVVPDSNPGAIASAVHAILELDEKKYAEWSARSKSYAQKHFSNASVLVALANAYDEAKGSKLSSGGREVDRI